MVLLLTLKASKADKILCSTFSYPFEKLLEEMTLGAA
jgi:hypothetical protein